MDTRTYSIEEISSIEYIIDRIMDLYIYEDENLYIGFEGGQSDQLLLFKHIFGNTFF